MTGWEKSGRSIKRVPFRRRRTAGLGLSQPGPAAGVLRWFFLLFLVLPLRAETVLNVPTAPEAEATIRLSAPWSQNPRFGFAPVMVSIENRAKIERSWHVEFEGGTRNFGTGALITGQDMAVPAGQTREVWIFVPLAEPGISVTSPGGAFLSRLSTGLPGGASKTVKIADVPTGKKITATSFVSAGARFVTEVDVNAKTGVIVTTVTPPSGPPRLTTRTVPLPAGSEVTFTIDRGTGLVTSTTHAIAGSKGPAVTRFVESGSAPRSSGVVTPAPPSGAGVGSLNPMALSVEVTGPGVAAAKLFFPGTSAPNTMRPLAVSTALEPILRAKLSTVLSGAPNLAAVHPEQLPADWRVWSSFSGVVLTSEEYRDLDAARRSVLRAWVALGGQLYLAPADAAVGESARTGEAGEKIGAGSIAPLSGSLDRAMAESRITGGSAPTPGGAAAAPPPATSPVESATAAEFQAQIAARRAERLAGNPAGPANPAAPQSSAPLARASGAQLKAKMPLFTGTTGLPDRDALKLEKESPLGERVKDENPDRTWLAAFLVLFAVVVGPLNLFWFAPAQRRHRLFLTTPLISLAASIILGVTILVQDGLGGSGARRALVVLLPGENQAAVFQEQAATTGFLARRTFALPDDVQLTTLPLEEPMFVTLQTALARGNGRASGDWFRSRSRQAHLLQRVAPTRSRIERVGTSPDGAPIVQSSLGTALREFVFVGANGELWKTAELPAGKRVTLERGGVWLADRGGPLVPGGSPRFKAVFDAVAVEVPGHWGALGDATEFAPIATLGSIRWEKSDVIYVGTLENEGAAAPAVAPAKSPGNTGEPP